MFATRQLVALQAIFGVPAMIFKALLDFDFKRIGALFVAIVQLLGAFIFDTPVTPYKDSIDMGM